MVRTVTNRDRDDSLAVRAAWLHYVGGLTQAEVAARLGIPNVKAHRLIMWANQNGVVKFSIHGDVTECVAIETRIAELFGLDYCEVLPDLYDKSLLMRALGVAGAEFLQREIKNLQSQVIGIGNGRTLAAAIAAMPTMDAGDVRFVSLLGGLTRNYAANPHDVMHRLAEKTGAVSYVMPVPFFANSVEDREVLLSQRGVRHVFDLAARADLMLIGIGTAELDSQLVVSQMIEVPEMQDVRDHGGVGEMLGHFFDADGKPVETTLGERTLSPSLESMKARRIVAIAGGPGKIPAIRSALLSGCLSGLIIDEQTASALVNDAS
ncbi:sugar-binding transcriptional regulator [Rhizobium sp. Root483D2]|uniref:sugar-binding transcriptional regulator n=1 Tax=Rhizobium sp. Root483D2 TaxID=1736545 RepID=UPI000714DBF7|nr:sugar-binding transcriptional regulator [Rhizobium sp. Root483D2]KQY42394.1 DNA-binding transcriptional regulator [Rhizobium sp. Root483D2]